MNDTIESIADEMLCECDPISPELVHEYARRLMAVASPAQGWRPIELDSPEDCDVVMLWWPGQSIHDYPFVGTTDDAETMRSAKPTHWHPLPPPPDGEVK